MTGRPPRLGLSTAAVLIAASLHGTLAQTGTKVEAAVCSIAAGVNALNNAVNCNFGLTPEQLKETTEAAVKGATGPLVDRIVEISRRLGVTEEAAQTLLRIVGEQPDIPDTHLAEVLTKIANDYKRLQAQAAALNPDNPNARTLVDGAKVEINRGDLENAHELLRQATQAQLAAAQQAGRLRERGQAAEEAQMLGAARSTATEGNVALTERHYLQAADLFGQAVSYVPRGHPDELSTYLSGQAYALLRQGDEHGQNAPMRDAIKKYKLALKEQTRARVPLEWAAAEVDLGVALSLLGGRERGTTLLQESADAFRSALKEFSRERMPLNWAVSQNNLGITLWKLGIRQTGTTQLRAAVTAFRLALEEETREATPLDWALAQNNLGLALWSLGERESGTARLIEAVAAYRLALEIDTRKLAPLSWALFQSNLGNALQTLGERETGTTRIKDAIVAFQLALKEYSRERVPLEWARTKNNLGVALQTVGKREGETLQLEAAVTVFYDALKERTRERVPLEWAMTQHNLGNTFRLLGEQEGGTARLEAAAAAFRAALEERTRSLVPLDWAYSQHGLAGALEDIALRLRDPDRMVLALASMRLAIEVYRNGRVAYWLPIAERRVATMETELSEMKRQ